MAIPYDIVFNPSTSYNEDGRLARWQRFVDGCKNERGLEWTGKKVAKAGDLYLFWFGKPKHFVGGIGIHDGEKFEKTKWPSPQIGFFPVIRLSSPVHLDEVHGDAVLAEWWEGNPFWGGPKTLRKEPDVARRLLKMIVAKNPSIRDLVLPYFDGLGFKPRAVTKSQAKNWANRIARLSAEEQDRVLRSVLRAERDRDLRPRVLALWGNACAACGMSLNVQEGGPCECEVAHVHEVRAKGTDDVDNALPVCRTHHWAFDHGLWTINPRTLTVVVARSHRTSSVLSSLHGRPLFAKFAKGPMMLNKAYLKMRYDSFDKP
jgi:hypothetical protein